MLDGPLLEHEASRSCDLMVVGEPFEETDNAVAFPAGFNNSALLAALNQALTVVSGPGRARRVRAFVPSSPAAPGRATLARSCARSLAPRPCPPCGTPLVRW